MPGTIYLHAGTYKTATTLIQSLMVRYEKDLLKRGVYIPKTGLLDTNKIYNHARIAYEILTYENPKGWKLLHTMLDEARSGKYYKILVSSEDISALSMYPRRLRRLKQVLASSGYKPKIILATRDPEEFAESFYVEMVKEGYAKSPDRFVDDVIKTDNITHTKPNGIRIRLPTNQGNIVKPFVRVFGTANVIHIRYSRAIAERFFKIFDIKVSGKDMFSNERYDSNKISLLIWLNRVAPYLKIDREKALRRLNILLRRLPNYGRFEFPTAARDRLSAYLKSH